MNYNDYRYRGFMRDVEEHKVFIKSLELREWKGIHTAKTLKSTDGVISDFPTEITHYYEIIVEYIDLNRTESEENICFGTATDSGSQKEKAFEIYEMLKKEIRL